MLNNGAMNRQELRDSIVRLGPWHHDVEVAPGVRTGEPAPPGTYPQELGAPTLIQPERILSWLVGELYPAGLGGRSVLDCACNAGGYLFAAARLGAGRCFGFDVREHWIEQARFLAEQLPSEEIEFAALDLAALPSLNLAPFDVTLFNGILYHLPDPVAGLRVAADHTKELLVVNTSICPRNYEGLMLSVESTTDVMSGVHRLAWLPTGYGVLQTVLEWCGFPHTRLRFDVEGQVKGWRRIEVLAARDEKTFAHYDAHHARHQQPAGRAGWLRRLLRRG